jgi:HPt (histidine-containing phosphotransfer) domain-containing protein
VPTLDLEELRALTMDDRGLMREILNALIEDAVRHAGMLESAARDRDGARSVKIARLASRACANVGANAAADAFREIERRGASRPLLAAARSEIEHLRAEAGRI